MEPIVSNISLASSALLVSVEVNTWTATKQDRAVSNEITTSKNATADSARVTKILLSHCPQHKALLNYRQTIYNWLKRITFEWQGSWTILPTYRVEQFNRELTMHKAEFNKLLDEFVAVYPSVIADAAFKHGALFDRSEYPDTEDVRKRFRIQEFVTVVPKDDFRVAVSSAIADDLKQQYEAQMQRVVAQTTQSIREQLVTYASRLRDACAEVQAEADEEARSGKTKRRKIYESTFDNVRSMVDLIRNFNLTNDAELTEAADKLSELLGNHKLTDLRESAFARSEVHDDLSDMLGKFGPIATTLNDE